MPERIRRAARLFPDHCARAGRENGSQEEFYTVEQGTRPVSKVQKVTQTFSPILARKGNRTSEPMVQGAAKEIPYGGRDIKLSFCHRGLWKRCQK